MFNNVVTPNRMANNIGMLAKAAVGETEDSMIWSQQPVTLQRKTPLNPMTAYAYPVYATRFSQHWMLSVLGKRAYTRSNSRSILELRGTHSPLGHTADVQDTPPKRHPWAHKERQAGCLQWSGDPLSRIHQPPASIWRKNLHKGQVLCRWCSISTYCWSANMWENWTSHYSLWWPQTHTRCHNRGRIEASISRPIWHAGGLQRGGQAPPEARLWPFIDPPRKCSIHLKEKLKCELKKMEKQGVIRKVSEHTDWCSSLAYSVKKDGSFRICIDPQKLNQALKWCPHKVPTLEELNPQFAGSTVFSKLDAKAGYWSVHLDPDSQLITTFRTPFGRYCWTRLPFGLRVSQDIFQARMDKILEDLPGVVGITDDVCVHGKDEEEHD